MQNIPNAKKCLEFTIFHKRYVKMHINFVSYSFINKTMYDTSFKYNNIKKQKKQKNTI